ncbi:MAG UNVERIFIED_CONTAM: sulfatase-like hydrolase/transferase [Anaerolineae bacterium]
MVHHIQQQFARSNWLFRVSMSPMLTPLWTRLINYKGHTERSLQDASETIRAHHGQPLFTFINLMGHICLIAPQSALDSVAPHLKHDRRAYEFVRHFNSEGAKWASPPDPQLTAWQQRALLDFYDAEVRHQDELLGKFLHGLDSHGILDNTLVIIMADHGEGHGDHQFLGHGFVVYQELVHVPLLIRFPNREGRGAKGEHAHQRTAHLPYHVRLRPVDPTARRGRPERSSGGVVATQYISGCGGHRGANPLCRGVPPILSCMCWNIATPPSLIACACARSAERSIIRAINWRWWEIRLKGSTMSNRTPSST